MKNITQFPIPVSTAHHDVIVLPCALQLHFDPLPLSRLFEHYDSQKAEQILCLVLEDIAVRLDQLQRGLAFADFEAMKQPARRITAVADQIGLVEVGLAATHVHTCLIQQDTVGLDATLARLERGFDIGVMQVWDFRD